MPKRKMPHKQDLTNTLARLANQIKDHGDLVPYSLELEQLYSLLEYIKSSYSSSNCEVSVDKETGHYCRDTYDFQVQVGVSLRVRATHFCTSSDTPLNGPTICAPREG